MSFSEKVLFTAAQPWLASGLVVGSGEKEEKEREEKEEKEREEKEEEKEEEEEKNLEIAFRIIKGLTKV